MNKANYTKRHKAELLCSSITGIAKVLIIQPFDFVRYRIQSAVGDYHFRINQMIKEIIRKEGLMVLWKGVNVTSLGVFVSSFLHFTMYQKCLKLYSNERNPIQSAAKAGFLSGVILAIITTPIDNVRIKLQSIQNVENLKQRKYKMQGSVDCVRIINNSYGLRGFYIALPVSVLRESIASTIYFGLFEYLKLRDKLKNKSETIKVKNSLMYGAIVGGMNWLVTLPIDTIKTKMISDTIISNSYTNFFGCVNKIYTKVGWTGFYTGFSVVFTRGLIVNAVVLTSFDTCRYKLLDAY